MPGSVSDAYDPEWGTASAADEIRYALDVMHRTVSRLLGDAPPIFIGSLVQLNLPATITATLNEKQWRLIRFALERAKESI